MPPFGCLSEKITDASLVIRSLDDIPGRQWVADVTEVDADGLGGPAGMLCQRIVDNGLSSGDENFDCP